MIKGIFFDAAGVIYYRHDHTGDFAIKLLQEKGFSREMSAQDLERLETQRGQANLGLASHDMYWELFLSMYGVTNPEQRKNLTSQIVDFSNNVLPVPGVVETLAGLKQRGFILGIVTDTMYPVEWKMRRLKKVGVSEFIDVIACSTVLGEHKPALSMYMNAIQQAHLAPNESAFVGHLAIELKGAKQAGMATVAVNYDPDAQADYLCQSLPDLLSLPIFQKAG